MQHFPPSFAAVLAIERHHYELMLLRDWQIVMSPGSAAVPGSEFLADGNRSRKIDRIALDHGRRMPESREFRFPFDVLFFAPVDRRRSGFGNARAIWSTPSRPSFFGNGSSRASQPHQAQRHRIEATDTITNHRLILVFKSDRLEPVSKRLCQRERAYNTSFCRSANRVLKLVLVFVGEAISLLPRFPLDRTNTVSEFLRLPKSLPSSRQALPLKRQASRTSHPNEFRGTPRRVPVRSRRGV